MPVSLEISAATFTSKPFFVFRPCTMHESVYSHLTASTTHSTDGSTTLSEKTQARERVFYTVNAVRQLLDVAAELLAKGKRCRILVKDPFRQSR